MMNTQNKTSKFIVLLSGAALFFASSCKVADSGLNQNYPGDIKLSLAHPFNKAKHDFELLFAAPLTIETLIICDKPQGCELGSPEVFTTELIYQSDTRKFFRSTTSALLERGLQLAFVGYNVSGVMADVRFVEFEGGPDLPGGTQVGGNLPSASTQGSVTGLPSTTVDGASLITANCTGAGCHSNPLPYSKQQALQAVQSGSMPRNRPISQDVRAQLINYLSQP